MDTFCHESLITTNTQGEIANVTNERRISSDIMAEAIRGFNGLTIQSKIKDSVYYISEENDPESDPNSNSLVATHTSDGKKRKVTDTDTTNGNCPHKLLINRIVPEINPVAIPPIDQTITEDATGSGETFHAGCTILSKEIVTDTACSAAHFFRTPADVSRHGTDGTTPRDVSNAMGSTRLASLVRIGGSTTGSPSRTGSQDIISPRGSISPQWSRDAQPLDISNNGNYSKHRYPATTWSKVIVRKFTN